jgi:hypothetical protein
MKRPSGRIKTALLIGSRGYEFLSATLTVSANETQRFAHYPGHTKQPR